MAATMCAEFVTACPVAHGDLPPLSGGYRSGYLTRSISFLSVIIITNLVVDEVVGSALAMWPQGCMAIGRQVGGLSVILLACHLRGNEVRFLYCHSGSNLYTL